MSGRLPSLRRFSTIKLQNSNNVNNNTQHIRTTVATISASPRLSLFSSTSHLPKNSKSNLTLTLPRLRIPTNLILISCILCIVPFIFLLRYYISSLSSSKFKYILDDDLSAAARRSRPLPKCASSNQPAKTFIMIFMGHSGSSAILSELRKHSKVHMEVSELVDHQKQFNTTHALIETRNFFDRGLKKGKVSGFKLRPMHILNAPQQWQNLVNHYSTRIIWQYRQNLFKASVGEYATRYLNDTSAVEGLKKEMSRKERCKKGSCSFKIENFSFLHDTIKQKFNSHNAITNAVHAINGNDLNGNGCVREVPYEDYLYNRESTMKDIQKFLGLPYENTKPSRFKATGDSLCQVVENWDQVCTFFYGCMLWQPMMNDARNKCFCNYSTGPTKYCSLE